MSKFAKVKNNNLLILILTIGVFGIINTEMGVIGILPLIAQHFNVTVPQAGWVVSVFALVVAISGCTMPLLFSGVNRKLVMVLTLSVFVISNIISIFTSSFAILLIARIIPAIFHPIYVSMAFSIAASSVDRQESTKAVSRIFIGVSAGMVLGVPVSSLIASETSLAMAMLFFAIVNMLVLLATIFLIPSMRVKEKLSYNNQLKVLKKVVTWESILAIVFINGAMFGFFSYLSDYLKNVTEVSFKIISIILFFYGGANIIGNLIAGKLLAQRPAFTIKVIPFIMIITYVILLLVGKMMLPMGIIIFLLGILAGIASNNCQYMISQAAFEAPDFANGLFLTSANLGTALGTAFCGIFISQFDIEYAVVGSLIFLIAAIVMIFLREHQANY